MELRMYERLSRVYDLDWGDFALQYVDLIEELLTRESNHIAHILDIACGTGTLLIELVRRGHSGFGIDQSPEMIERARNKAKGLPNIGFGVQNITGLHMSEGFDLISCTFDSLNYVIKMEKVQKVFHGVALHLRNQGYFIFDSNTYRQYMNNHNFAQAYELDGVQFIQRMKYDPQKRLARTVFEFSSGEREVHVQRPYGFSELKPMLKCAGLNVVHKYAGFKGERFTLKSERLICITQKA